MLQLCSLSQPYPPPGAECVLVWISLWSLLRQRQVSAFTLSNQTPHIYIWPNTYSSVSYCLSKHTPFYINDISTSSDTHTLICTLNHNGNGLYLSTLLHTVWSNPPSWAIPLHLYLITHAHTSSTRRCVSDVCNNWNFEIFISVHYSSYCTNFFPVEHTHTHMNTPTMFVCLPEINPNLSITIFSCVCVWQ